MNEKRQKETGDLDVAARIASYELAFRMQMSAPELLDFSKESASTLESYGVNQEPTHPFATNCLLARRMVERGVRFVMFSTAAGIITTRSERRAEDQLRRDRSPNGRFAQGPQAARACLIRRWSSGAESSAARR